MKGRILKDIQLIYQPYVSLKLEHGWFMMRLGAKANSAKAVNVEDTLSKAIQVPEILEKFKESVPIHLLWDSNSALFMEHHLGKPSKYETISNSAAHFN